MKRDAASHYHARMMRVIDHIDAHLEDDLSVDVLSGVAAFSKFHFQRQFSATFEIGIHRYVQLARLKRASYRLAYREDQPILAIALDSGYEGPEAFARAFRQRFDQSPSGFRSDPDWGPWHAAFEPLNQARSSIMTQSFTDDQVRIIDFPATPVAVMEHRGDPTRIGDTLRRFIAWRKASGVSPRTCATFNVFHSGPDEGEDYRMDLCAATDRAVEPNRDQVIQGLIPAGRCAVLRQIGSGDDLAASATFLYREWLPRSGCELRDFPFFAQRVSFMPDVPEHEAVTDLYLPIR
ncbi:AraC family transcriptional regulator [Sphingomonas sp. LB-2]|uniref:AraC family transcriptional regulator n=1 Tax=Sphingomonas caeni TaxID=2984949 RepID=UPI00222FC999|nr:AraC family transcriptional regulator [Sphingomonas caeni]MCW3846133.1 AraC family transcriptional regulator [Sphingomonas caeni]